MIRIMQIRSLSIARRQQVGFTLVELMIAVAMIALLATIALPSLQSFIERTNVRHAAGDIQEIAMALERYQIHTGNYPDDLGEVGMDTLQDPWGNPCQYLNLVTNTNPGKVRKDKSLVPINTDFDLYSMGKDGDSKAPLTAMASRDDVVRASNGDFVGLAIDY